jgi:diketogulonate reductase-like aldo/keto reductase
MLGFGTYRLKGETAMNAVGLAVKQGYTQFDTAQLYGNEASVGQALSQCGLKRSEYSITTKIPDDVQKGGKDVILKSVEDSLIKLKTDYIDLLLLHSPCGDQFLQSWIVLEELMKVGKVKTIGVSNFIISDLTRLYEIASIRPSTNQIEVNPFITRTELVKFCEMTNLQISAHSPLAKGEKFNNAVLNDISVKHGLTPAQVMIRWGYQKGYNVLPRSSNASHIHDDFESIFSSEVKGLLDIDMQILEELNEWYATHPKFIRDKIKVQSK